VVVVILPKLAEGKRWPKMSAGNLVRRWSAKPLPARIRIGICLVCDKMTLTYGPEEPHFHWACHQEWKRTPEGRYFQSLKVRGQDPSLKAPESGRPLTEDNLKLSYSLAIQHYLGDKSYRDLAKENQLSHPSVIERIKFIKAHLPKAEVVGSRFRRSIELLLDS
jgi:hypothetical protein